MLKKLLLILILGLIVSPVAFGVTTAAYAVEDDNSQGQSDSQGEDEI